MIKLCVIHGPNLNLLGAREPDIYGAETYDELNRRIKDMAKQLDVEVRIFQSNAEGELIDMIQQASDWADGIIINPGAYTHYSYAIRDALSAVRLPVAEVHITNVHSRDEWRRRAGVARTIAVRRRSVGCKPFD